MKTTMDYSLANEWILGESAFSSDYLGKCEAVMCLGNGYMGMRSATEEKYMNETRDFFVAGTFNQFDSNEVTELPNAADLTGIEIEIDGQRFNLEKGEIKDYYRQLNLKNGELRRTIKWETPEGKLICLEFRRLISMKRLHVLAQQVSLKCDGDDIKVRIISGIDGQMTNNGSQHFSEGAKRLYDQRYMEYLARTTNSGIDFVFHTCLCFKGDGKEIAPASRIVMERRQIFCEYSLDLSKGCQLVIEKLSTVFTSRDKENEDKTLEQIQSQALKEIQIVDALGFDRLLEESESAWNELVWERVPLSIESRSPKDQLAIRFAQYHLYVMTPRHDHRMHVGAKGLSGEGYKGHTFWDTDIFVLPYFTFTNPEIAKGLGIYRYLSLPGAHKKAKDNGYEGAMYPWESAWLDDGEVTPVWGAADIITGQPIKIWSGFIEQHITSDVAYGVWQYYKMTGDEDFMQQYGYELLMDTAKFWASRLEWSDKDQLYHINDVVGPDEYKEHVDDNAFTNYMAWWNIALAMNYYRELKENDNQLYRRLEEKLALDAAYKKWEECLNKIYLPKPRHHDLIIPQHKTYLDLKDIDLTKYKNQEHVGSLFYDYNLEQVNEMQVSKQADLLILFLLMEDLFSEEVKKANWDYYEPRTLHDSSLSLSTHCILANDLGDKRLAYELFERAREIDMGMNMKSSDAGIHAASIGGIWQCTVFGFGGVRMLNGKLRINPQLPDEWDAMNFYMYWQGQKLNIRITHEDITVVNETADRIVEIEVNHQVYQLDKEMTCKMCS